MTFFDLRRPSMAERERIYIMVGFPLGESWLLHGQASRVLRRGQWMIFYLGIEIFETNRQWLEFVTLGFSGER